MGVVHLIFRDTDDGAVEVRCVSDRPIPDSIEEWTAAEMIARQSAEAINKIMEAQYATPVSES